MHTFHILKRQIVKNATSNLHHEPKKRCSNQSCYIVVTLLSIHSLQQVHIRKMALRDKACYTLNLIPSLKDPTIIELVENLTADKEVEAKYVRVREDRDGEVYSSVIYGEYRLHLFLLQLSYLCINGVRGVLVRV